jgi:hypothetical protein
MTPEPGKDWAHAGSHAVELIRNIIITVETTPNAPVHLGNCIRAEMRPS